MCEEVFDSIEIPKDVFLESQQAYLQDSATKEELTMAVQTGRPSTDTLKARPDLAKSMQDQISAV